MILQPLLLELLRPLAKSKRNDHDENSPAECFLFFTSIVSEISTGAGGGGVGVREGSLSGLISFVSSTGNASGSAGSSASASSMTIGVSRGISSAFGTS